MFSMPIFVEIVVYLSSGRFRAAVGASLFYCCSDALILFCCRLVEQLSADIKVVQNAYRSHQQRKSQVVSCFKCCT